MSSHKKTTTNYEKYKNAYLDTKYKTFNRAATIIFEKHDSKNMALILLNNKKWNTYTDIGGKIENETLIETAIRELQEESFNMFNLNSEIYNNLHFVDIQNKKTNKWCRVYVICIKANIIDTNIYYHNKKIIESHNDIGLEWKETDGITKFNMSDIIECSKKYAKNDQYCVDVLGTKQKIYCDTLNEISEIINKKVLDKIKCIELTLVNSDNHGKHYLNGTKMYIQKK